MALTEAQKRAKEKYRKSEKGKAARKKYEASENGRYSKYKLNAFNFLRVKAKEEDLVKIKAEIKKILKEKYNSESEG